MWNTHGVQINFAGTEPTRIHGDKEWTEWSGPWMIVETKGFVNNNNSLKIDSAWGRKQ